MVGGIIGRRSLTPGGTAMTLSANRWARVLAPVLAGSFLGIATPASAQTTGALPPNVGSDCDRACLQGLAEQFIGALLAHDPSKVPLAKNVRYSENSVPLPIPDGFWKNATGVRPYRLYIADPEWGTIGFYARMYENGAPVIVSTRLRVYD